MKAIINTETKEYFSLMSDGLFTKNIELASRFERAYDAEIVIESYIDNNDGFEKFGMIDTMIIDLYI